MKMQVFLDHGNIRSEKSREKCELVFTRLHLDFHHCLAILTSELLS